MVTVTNMTPWFFAFYKELASVGKYKFGNLFYRRDGIECEELDKEDRNLISKKCHFAGVELNLNKLNFTCTTAWLYETREVVNPEPEPTSFWEKFFSDEYIAKWTVYYPIAHIEIKSDSVVEVWVFGEKHLREIDDLLKKLSSLEGQTVNLELRQVNEVTVA